MRGSRVLVTCLALLPCVAACTSPGPIDLDGQDIQLTIIHTTDIHSRLVPYDLQVGEVDKRLGLVQNLEPFGGAARVAAIIKRERAQAGRVLWLDSGDSFQGAPIFNFFHGETEIRLLDMVGVDSMVIGNHEFDLGGNNLYEQLRGWAHFPALAANYRWEDPELPYNSHLGEVSEPYTIMNMQGLRVAVIGIANMSSINSIYDTGNRLGITPLDTVQTLQYYVDFLKPQVDLIVVTSHLGLTADVGVLENVTGVDVALGGHHHVVLNPPRVIIDPDGRAVLNPHSGAFAKYVGRLDLIVRQCSRIPECVARYEGRGEGVPENDWEVVSSRYEVFPIDSTVPEDPRIADMMEAYTLDMQRQIDLNALIGYAPNMVRRYGTTGGDSELGNLLATAMRRRRGIETEFALTNTLGIRADFNAGPVSVEQMYNVFPFENTIATVNLSGAEVQELFDFIAERSAGRGCNTQAQIAGAAVVLDCAPRCPSTRRNDDGSCQVAADEYRPVARRILINDASPPASDACQEMHEAFAACCAEVARCGCADDNCLESICEDEARASRPGCDAAFEPFYATDPCGIGQDAGDAECRARGDNQRCFIHAGRALGRCMDVVVDDYRLLDAAGAYGLAANDYIARGGSGFRVLGRNTSVQVLDVSLREVLIEHIRTGEPCTDNAPCTVDADCLEGEACACDARAAWDGDQCSSEATPLPDCPAGEGRCVLAACIDDVAAFRADRVDPCGGGNGEARARCECTARRWAQAECQVLPCIDDRLGAVTDGRQTMVQP